ncbi:hypothetical protein RND71_036750 [Anisodus tanguticus]|uniref:Uncharacterized protein n=1 Tax=Anisodus tanguticus TaxID=243964 RepID=A0AAE1R2C7_9SOLA|nr:hypothetical protein RND71_036750 [Anisodus tanguticus]
MAGLGGFDVIGDGGSMVQDVRAIALVIVGAYALVSTFDSYLKGSSLNRPEPNDAPKSSGPPPITPKPHRINTIFYVTAITIPEINSPSDSTIRNTHRFAVRRRPKPNDAPKFGSPPPITPKPHRINTIFDHSKNHKNQNSQNKFSERFDDLKHASIRFPEKQD